MKAKRLASIAMAAILAVGLCPGRALAGEPEHTTAVGQVATQSLPASLSTQSAAQKVTTGTTNGYVSFGYDTTARKAGGAFFQQKQMSGNNTTVCNIVMTKGGKKSTLLKDADYGMATNGKYLYYSKSSYTDGTYYNRSRTTESTIYRMNLNTGKETAIVSGSSLMVNAATSKYLYYSVIYPTTQTFYVYTLATGKVKKLNVGTLSSPHIAHVECAKGRVVVQPTTNTPIYSFKQDGTNRKVIVKSSSNAMTSFSGFSIRNGVVYYTLAKGGFKGNTWVSKYKAAKCSVTGKNKKVVVNWTTNQSKVYKYGWM